MPLDGDIGRVKLPKMLINSVFLLLMSGVIIFVKSNILYYVLLSVLFAGILIINFNSAISAIKIILKKETIK